MQKMHLKTPEMRGANCYAIGSDLQKKAETKEQKIERNEIDEWGFTELRFGKEGGVYILPGKCFCLTTTWRWFCEKE